MAIRIMNVIVDLGDFASSHLTLPLFKIRCRRSNCCQQPTAEADFAFRHVVSTYTRGATTKAVAKVCNLGSGVPRRL